MIFDEHRAIHLHIPKTAGVAVEHLLRAEDRDANVADFRSLFGFDRERQVYLQHASAALVRELARDRFEDFFVFTVVRNPFSRLFSAYYYLGPQHDAMFGSFEEFVLGLPDYLQVEHRHRGSHFIPQTRYTHLDEQPTCHHVAYFEHLPDALDPVRARLGITAELTVRNRHRPPFRPTNPIAEHFTAPMISVVHEVYAQDFALLGYRLDPEQREPISAEIPRTVLRPQRREALGTGLGAD